MIFTENRSSAADSFALLMAETDFFLNKDASLRPEYYAKRSGILLEDDVKSAMDYCAVGTPFAGTIHKVSGHKFPDIVAGGYYGTEVKSTRDDRWTSVGSSILESTRVESVERIFLTFGKLGGRPQFVSRPYEECMYGISVTHMPRYLIDMCLQPGCTVFDKMGISYDCLRRMSDPVAPVAEYYRSQLKPGERLWWTGANTDESVSAVIRMWRSISPDEKRRYTAYACVNFPEIFKGNYDGYAVWLVSQGIADPSVRDQFSSGGKEPMLLSDGSTVVLPGVYRRIKNNLNLFISIMRQQDTAVFNGCPAVSEQELSRRLKEWTQNVSRYYAQSVSVSNIEEFNACFYISVDALHTLFNVQPRNSLCVSVGM